MVGMLGDQRPKKLRENFVVVGCAVETKCAEEGRKHVASARSSGSVKSWEGVAGLVV